MTTDLYRVALNNCEQEPIRTPASIQSAGALLALDPNWQTFTHCSANVHEVLGVSVEDVFQTPPTQLLPSALRHDVRNALATHTSPTHREHLGHYMMDGKPCDVSLHLSKQRPVLEFEPNPFARPTSQSPLLRVRTMLSRVQRADSLEDLLDAAIKTIRISAAFERVMVYRFLPNGDGEVVAEVCQRRMEPFLGLRYPASDIPQIARNLYIQAPLRAIYDVQSDPIPLIARTPQEPALDLSLAYLRAVSPIHIEYLKNMGVQSTLSLPIILDGELWGLFACHNARYPLHLPPDVRSTCELFAQMFSLLLHQHLDRERLRATGRIERARTTLLSLNASSPSDVLLQELAPTLKDLIPCDGIALHTDTGWSCHGLCLKDEELDTITAYTDDTSQELCPLDELTVQFPDLPTDSIAGALVINILAEPPIRLVFLREPIPRKIRWGGDPRKQLSHGPSGPRLTPRASFQAYIETVHNRCESWTSKDLQTAAELRTLLLEHLMRKKWISNRRQQVLVAELNHRIKNIFTLLRSLARQTSSSAESIKDYARALDQRIVALANAHDLATGYNTQGASLEDLIRTELHPQLNAPPPKHTITISGPDITLRPDLAPMMALLLHELTTNAVKHGSLSVEQGQLNLTWERQGDGVSMTWRESNGPTVTPPENSTGFGLVLLERAIPYEFGGNTAVHFHPEGLEVTFTLPASTLLQDAPTPSLTTQGSLGAPLPPLDLSQAHILVLEDNMLLAMDTEDLLRSFGCESLDLAPSVPLAHKMLANNTYTLAVLDINLGGTTSYEIARTLKSLEIPFFFMSGYGSANQLPEDLQDCTILSKPVETHDLRMILQQLTQ